MLGEGGGFFPALVDLEPIGCRHVWYLQVTIGCGREVGEKKQVQQSGAMRTGLLDGKNSCYPGYFYSSLSHFLKKRELFLCFLVLVFRGAQICLGGGGLLILVIGYLRCCFFFLFLSFFLLFPPSPGIGDGGGGLVRASFCVLTFGAWQG